MYQLVGVALYGISIPSPDFPPHTLLDKLFVLIAGVVIDWAAHDDKSNAHMLDNL